MTRTLLLTPVLVAAVAVAAGSAATAAGDELAVSLPSGATTDVVVVGIDGRVVRRLTSDRRASDYFPVWSPDGRRVVFVSNRDGDDELFVMSANGSGLRQLTRNRAVDTTPAWSPDGRSLVFASNRAGGEHKLYVLRVDTGSARQLTRGPRTAFDVAPSWSSDGKLIAFASNRAAYANSDIWLVRPDGTALRRLTRTPGSESRPGDEGTPAFSPDGRRIAFSTNRDRQQEIYVMDADGTDARRLTRAPGRDDILPRWSPDGRSLAFTGTPFPQGRPSVYIAPASGGAVRRVTAGGDASWRP